jgi:NhaB family Na+:H+ antiporter
MTYARFLGQQIAASFLGRSPDWYKLTILVFLTVNPMMLIAFGPFVTGWLVVLEFIFTLAMALRCYPLAPGGLVAFEAVLMGMTSPAAILHEVENNFEVILLLIFMVAGVFFLKDLLLYIFTKLLVNIRSKIRLSLTFSVVAAVLSAFLDALTVTAIIIAVVTGFYSVYHRVASGKTYEHADHDPGDDRPVDSPRLSDLLLFRAFLRSLVMHAAVGTALGGVATIVGEPQNLLIASKAGWSFVEFFVRMAPVSLPVLGVGLLTCMALERFRWFGYGAPIPEAVRVVLVDFDQSQTEKRTPHDLSNLFVQAMVVLFLVMGLAFHLAAVGIIGLGVIVLVTAFTGITDEHRLGQAFQEALPFTALLAVFFSVVAIIDDQGLFKPIINGMFALPLESQPPVLFLVNGMLSAISDNVFVATVYINEIKAALDEGNINRAQFDLLAVAINAGTNIPSIATPNGQAAFLFLLTSGLAPLIRLSYPRMVAMALPYVLTMTTTGFLAIIYLV